MHQLWVIAGPNGSGKTSLTRRHLAGKLPIVNPDEIARDLNPDRPKAPEASLRAGREALLQRRQLIAARQSFAVETTFSGNQEIALIKTAKEAGYKVNLVFICTDSPWLSMGRIAVRVMDGGHHVPGADVERRYQRSLANLPEGLALADRAWLLDNTRTRMRLVASIERGEVKTMINAQPKWVRQARLAVLEPGLSR
ncbi:AAA family ATPase [Magnetospirillum sp. 15-1]|uniref:AAA family ATPase n=1 Tax=Magnetospirillum sp. 15-1 TaxID=1979370 RepID=UPI000BBC7692|nr:AAA family ATPase [Magnetospirillum sp. 15-1]